MVRPIVSDPIILSRKAAPATAKDRETARDLADTLTANRDRCVGMAANMIGVPVAVIAFFDGGDTSRPVTVMFDPVIESAAEPYDAEEGCLSLSGVRKTVRYRRIRVRYRDFKARSRTGVFSGYTAQIIQHEVDHLGGILI